MKRFFMILVLGLLWCNTTLAESYEQYSCHDTTGGNWFGNGGGMSINDVGYQKRYVDGKLEKVRTIFLNLGSGNMFVNPTLSSKYNLVSVDTNEYRTFTVKFNKKKLKGSISEHWEDKTYGTDSFIKFKCKKR